MNKLSYQLNKLSSFIWSKSTLESRIAETITDLSAQAISDKLASIDAEYIALATAAKVDYLKSIQSTQSIQSIQTHDQKAI